MLLALAGETEKQAMSKRAGSFWTERRVTERVLSPHLPPLPRPPPGKNSSLGIQLWSPHCEPFRVGRAWQL